MGATVPEFDKLPQGTGYAKVPSPEMDAVYDSISGTAVPDSHNDVPAMEVKKVGSEVIDGPMNPAPYWNSGEAETLKILEP